MYFIFDLETTIIKKYNRTANCFVDDNWVVAEGWKQEGDVCASWN